MAELIDGGVDLFDALVYDTRPHPGTQQFVQSQLERLSTNMTDAGQRFYQNVQNAYDQFHDSTAMRYARAAKRAIGSIWQRDEIRALATIGDFQQAPPVMRRWVMAEPMTRQWYQQQRIEGYGDAYIDMQPGVLGVDHYDYRRAMDGLVVDDPETEDWQATSYLEELLPDDEDLLLDEQDDIQASWEHQRALLKLGRSDPTSRWNADL